MGAEFSNTRLEPWNRNPGIPGSFTVCSQGWNGPAESAWVTSTLQHLPYKNGFGLSLSQHHRNGTSGLYGPASAPRIPVLQCDEHPVLSVHSSRPSNPLQWNSCSLFPACTGGKAKRLSQLPQ